MDTARTQLRDEVKQLRTTLNNARRLADDAAGPWVDRRALSTVLTGQTPNTIRRFDLGNPLGWSPAQIHANEQFNARLVHNLDEEADIHGRAD